MVFVMGKFAPIDSAQIDKAVFIQQLRRRGIKDKAVIRAMEQVPREEFVGVELAEFAYDDTALPIESGQTISQPFMVALMIEALQLKPQDRVLEVGAGSGYAAAVLSQVVEEVFTIERHRVLASQATQRLERLHYNNVQVLCADGTLGWPEHAPFDAIVVAAAGPQPPQSLLEQLAIGGRLVMPTGMSERVQTLQRITRINKDELEIEELGAVSFVPLIGIQGWLEKDDARHKPDLRRVDELSHTVLSGLIAEVATPIASIEEADLSGLMERIGNSRLVLLGEASHGTAEFYDMRARITRELIEKKGFRLIAVEADWPDAAQINHFVRDTRIEPMEEATFTRFPSWMWANTQVLEFVKWLRHHNQQFEPEQRAGFYGLDLYSMYSSIHAVINYLEEVDVEAAAVARRRYGCLTPWETDPATYGAMALNQQHSSCEKDVIAILNTLLRKRFNYIMQDRHRFLDAISNARLVKNAEHYYRIMYRASHESWNFRDQHMFDTLQSLLEFHGSGSKAVVWAHNSHIGNAEATEMSARGEINIGCLCRRHYGQSAYLIGFGTHHGTVAAASNWGAPMEVKKVRPSHPRSYERVFHDSEVSALMLPLRYGDQQTVRDLRPSRLERAIGVIYRPETELQSHYFAASLPEQFDEYIWFDETRAVSPLGPESGKGLPETFPFGL
jgi:protein-L-isoaspartate(D-aspartate) O-methyltransferase